MPQRNAAIKITYRGRDTDRPNLRDWLQKVYNRVSMISVNGAYGAINNPNMVYGIFAEEGTKVHRIFKVPSGRKGRKGWLRFPNPDNPGGRWKRARSVKNRQGAQHFIQNTVLEHRDALRNDIKRAGLDLTAINQAINRNLLDLKAALEEATPEHVYYQDPAGYTEDRPTKPIYGVSIPEGHLRDNYKIVRARRRG